MADVARLADVSTATVSHFLSGREDLLKRMSPQVQLRVSEAVTTLGYVHNKTARHLRLKRTERICVLLPQLGIPYADQIAKDIDLVARRRGYTTVIVTGQSLDIWRRVLNEVEAGLADGVVCDGDEFTEAELADLFHPRFTKPRLVLPPSAPPPGFSVVNYNRVDALRQALDYFRDQGRKRIAYLANTTTTPSNVRAQLVRDFTGSPQNGMTLAGIVAGARSRETAAIAVRELLAMPVRPDCIAVESDFSAVTVIEELQRHGLRIPDDIGVIGCGNAEEGFYAYPRLTTIGPTAISLTDATSHLIDRIETGDHLGFQRFHLPWTLIKRDSA